MNIAVIGSNGFIGRHLTQSLSSNPENKIRLFGKKDNSFFSDAFPYEKLDLKHYKGGNNHFKNTDLIYYLASETIPSSSWNNPLLEIENNLIPFIKLLEEFSASGVKKVVFVSSAGTIYGPTSEKVNEQSDKNPFSPYGITKLSMEYYLNYFKKKHDLNFDVFRVSNIYGNGQDTSKGLGIINTFLESIISKGSVEVFGDGKTVRNYIYIADVVNVLKHSSLSPLNISNTYNLSSDDSKSINELIDIMKSTVAEKFKVNYISLRESDNPAILLDNSKLKKDIPELKFTGIKEGIIKTYLHIKEKAQTT